MDVPVSWIGRVERLRRAAKPSLLGDSLLERARSTTLALLGVTAAVGLAVVWLALQQGWPLVAGSPVPGLPGTDAPSEAGPTAGAVQRRGGPRPRKARDTAAPAAGTTTPVRRGSVSPPAPSSLLAVTDSRQVGEADGGSPGGRGDGRQQPQQPVVTQPSPAPAVASEPVSKAKEDQAEESPEATQSSSPPETTTAGVEEDDEGGWPWSKGKAHGHDHHDHGHDDDDDDDGGHGWGRGRGHGQGKH